MQYGLPGKKQFINLYIKLSSRLCKNYDDITKLFINPKGAVYCRVNYL